MSLQPFDCLIFDLDDTLLDTFGQLIPRASQEACVAMIEAGLNAELAECLNAREELAHTEARTDLYRHLVNRFGVRPGADCAVVAQRGHTAFHDRRVEDDISLFPGARDLLRDLRTRYKLFLVTAGHPPTQQEKIKILDLLPLFDSIKIVDVMNGQRKDSAFQHIYSEQRGAPSRYLSIGNRLDTDIAPAKRLGWKTCWVEYGEHANTEPHNEFENPDFRIHRLEELLPTCRL